MNRFDGKKVDWKKLIGPGCIVVRDSSDNVTEVKVLEVSPEGRVKFKFPTMGIQVERTEEYLLIKKLEEYEI